MSSEERFLEMSVYDFVMTELSAGHSYEEIEPRLRTLVDTEALIALTDYLSEDDDEDS